LLNGETRRIFNLSDTIPFWIWINPFLYTFVTGYGTVRGVDNFRRIPGVSNNTWSPTILCGSCFLGPDFFLGFCPNFLQIKYYESYLCQTLTDRPSSGWIYIIVSASRECVLSGVRIIKVPTRSTQIMIQWSGSSVLGGKSPHFLRSFLGSWQTVQVDHKRSTSFARSGHVMMFLIVFSVQVCPVWSKYSWYQDSTLCLMTEGCIFYLYNEEDHSL
jgi:hypothetical protein